MAPLIRRENTNIKGAPHLPNAPLLQFDAVDVRYNGTTALEAISFTLEARQQVAVVGPNGAGKSTLFKLIVGEIQPTTGVVHLYGSHPQHHLCVGYVPQRKAIDWSFPVTVRDVVMMGRTAQIGLFRWAGRRDRALVHDSLQRVDALHLADKQIGELSGGQQQRVFIARALAQQAELLLLDEPLTGLDTPTQTRLFDILDDVSRDGVTILTATHDLTLAAQRFDQVLLLNRRLVAIGEPQQVLTTANLARAYGGHLHTIADADGNLLIADSCCDHGDEHSETHLWNG